MDFSLFQGHGDNFMSFHNISSRARPPSTTNHFPEMRRSLRKSPSVGLPPGPTPKNVKQSSIIDPVSDRDTFRMPPSSEAKMDPTELEKYERIFKETVSNRRNFHWRPPSDRPEEERIRMSYEDFRKLDRILGGGESDYRYPSISYNSRTSHGIIQWMPSGVHDILGLIFHQKFSENVHTLPDHIIENVYLVGNKTTRGFQAPYKGSQKEADAMFKYWNGKDLLTTCAIEVGISQSYESLVDDAKMWLEGQRGLRTVILTKVEEEPRYRSPVHGWEDDEIMEAGFPSALDLELGMVTAEDPNDIFGNLSLCGFTWVHPMSAFLEIWKLDPKTLKAERRGDRMTFVGNMEDDLAELDLKLGDLYPVDEEYGQVKLPVTWQQLRQRLDLFRKELAKDRLQDVLEKVDDRQNGSKDGDYQP